MKKLSTLISCAYFAMLSSALAAGDTTHGKIDVAETLHSAGHGGTEHAAEHASKGGLPQFDPEWFASQVFWLAISFGLLYLIFAKKTLPDISSVIENRKNHIEADLKTAEKITAEADNVQESYQESLNKAQSDATEAIKNVENKSKLDAEKAIDDFRHKSDVALKETEKRIEVSKLAAMDDMNQIAAEAAAQAVEKIIGVSPDNGKIQATVKNISGKFQSNKAKAA